MADADQVARIQKLEKIARIKELEQQVASAPSGDSKTSAGKAFLVGAQDAASFGGRAALGAIGESIGTGIGTLISNNQPLMERIPKAIENAKLVFNPARAELTAEKAKAFEDQPLATLGGNVVGSVAQAPLIAAKGIAGAAKLGALGGVGKAASEAESLGEAVELAGEGAAIGAAMGGIGKAASAAGGKIKDAGAKLAFKTLGPGARDAKINLAKNQVEKIGAALIDQGIIKTTPSSIPKIAERVGKQLADVGGDLGAAVDRLDDLAVQKGLDKYGVSTAQIASEVLKDVKVPASIPGAAAKNQKAAAFVKEFVATNPEVRGIKDAESFKRIIGDQINWNIVPGTEVSTEQKLLRSLYAKIKENSEKAAIKVAEDSGKELSDTFKNTKSLFSLLKSAEKIVNDKEGRLLANNLLSPSDKAAGLLGIVAGATQGDDLEDRLTNAAIGASLGVANRTLRTAGTQAAAKGLYGLGSSLQNLQQGVGPLGRTLLYKAIDQTTPFSRRLKQGE